MSTPAPPPPSTPARGTRYAQLIRLNPSSAAAYRRLHAAAWPGVLARIRTCNIRDYSIHYEPQLGLLFARFTYVGDDFAADMARMREDEETRRWWAVTDGMQESLNEGATGSEGGGWWRDMEEVFYVE